MKIKLMLALGVGFLLFQWQLSSCASDATKNLPGEDAVKNFYFQQTDSLISELSQLDSAALLRQPVDSLKAQFANCRFTYKKTEILAEYYFQGLTKRINGPALPDIKTEDGQVWPPHGFQVIEQFLYSGYADSLQPALSREIKLLQTDLRFMRKNMEYNSISSNHIQEMIQHQFIRIAALGITGFDAPLSKLSIQEASNSLVGIRQVGLLYNEKNGNYNDENDLLKGALSYLEVNKDFDTFNRLEFLTAWLMPLSDWFGKLNQTEGYSDSLMTKPFRGTLSQLLKGKGFDADYYSSYAIAKTNPDKIALGKKLFFDNKLSKSGTISCASCHQPGQYFTDGKEKAGDFVHGGTLPRNTPSLYYTALQSHQFYDLRSVTLEDQANEVMKSSNEFNLSSLDIAKTLLADKQYLSLFTKAFELKEEPMGGFEVRNALAAFVRSLSPFSSPFDEYMNGNKSSLSEEQVQGFNLFTGKAKCATCHFIPLFNGNIPPWFNKSESEIIGVPLGAVWENAIIDPDSGRYKINRMNELMFAFKTPGIRNIEKTAPYMHNGVYKTMEDVVEFYHKGGGVGLGINLPFQSLPFDSLSLNGAEKKAIIAFMQSLTDKKTGY